MGTLGLWLNLEGTSRARAAGARCELSSDRKTVSPVNSQAPPRQTFTRSWLGQIDGYSDVNTFRLIDLSVSLHPQCWGIDPVRIDRHPEFKKIQLDCCYLILLRCYIR